MRLTSKRRAYSLPKYNTNATIETKWSPTIAKYGHTAIPNLLLISSAELSITPPEFMTLVSLLSFKWDERRPDPGIKRICSQTTSTPRTARKHIASLESKGLLKRIPRDYRTNEYDFTPLVNKLDKIAETILPTCQDEPEGTVSNDQALQSEVTAKEYSYKQDVINKNTTVSADTAKSAEQIKLVYDYFIKQFETNPQQFKLTPKRKTKIKARLKDCGYEMLTLAIDNVAATGFYRGDNERGWKADLDYITRSYEQVEKLSQLNAQTVTYKADW